MQKTRKYTEKHGIFSKNGCGQVKVDLSHGVA